MAKTQTISVPEELQPLFNRSIKQTDRFVHGGVGGKQQILSRARKNRLRDQSLFGFLATFWRELSEAEKDAWRSAGTLSNLTNWQLFISDNAARLRHELEFPVSPNDDHQVMAGRLNIEAPADEIILEQKHPHDYWVARRVPGKPWRNELVLITEDFALPLEIEISYKSDLTAEGSEQSARYYAQIWSSYQGVDTFTNVEIPFSPSTDWTRDSAVIENVIGHTIGYSLFLEIKGYRGEVLFDNIRAIHSGQNWARDPRADNIDREFTGAFVQVLPYWLPVSVPDGATFTSVFPPSL